MIKVQGLSKSFGDRLVLNDIDFVLDKGEMALLTGASGAGKSTLLGILTGSIRASSGEAWIKDICITHSGSQIRPVMRQQMGIVQQTPYFLPQRSVFDNIALPLMIRGESGEIIQKRVQAALEHVGLGDAGCRSPETLSGGELQRAGIARALVISPKIIIADEPTGNLDPDTARDIFQLFDLFRVAGATVLIATHDLALVARTSHVRMNLDQGKLEVQHV